MKARPTPYRVPQPVKAELVRRNITQREVARLADCSCQWVKQVCNGYFPPGPRLSRVLPEILDMELADLFTPEMLVRSDAP